MYVEELILAEKILTREHIDELYCIFVSLCSPTRFKIEPKDFTETFQNIARNKSININDELWRYYFVQIDINRDGRIDFQDFLRYTYQHLKMILGTLTYKNGLNQLHSLSTLNDKHLFWSLISNFFLKLLNHYHPFWLTDSASTYLPIYISYTYNINKHSVITHKTSNEKYELFSHMLNSINNNDLLSEIKYLIINPSNIENVNKGFERLKKILKPINYITSHYLLANYISPIMEGLKTIALNKIFETIITILTSSSSLSTIKSETLYNILKIIKRVLVLANYLQELTTYCNDNSLPYITNNINDINNFLTFINTSLLKDSLSKHLAYFINYNDYAIMHCSVLIVLEIAKKGIAYLKWVITFTNVMDVLIAKTQNFVMYYNSVSTGTTMYNIYHEMNLVLFCCVNIIEQIIVIKDYDKEVFEIVIGVINKLSVIANGFYNCFFILSQLSKEQVNCGVNYDITLSMFLVFVGLLSLHSDNIVKGSFDDKKFMRGVIELKVIESSRDGQLIYPFYFYVKCLLRNANKNELVGLIADLKVLNLFYAYAKTKETFMNDVLDLFDVLIAEQKTALISTTVIREVFAILEDVLSNDNNVQCCYKVIKLMNDITQMKDVIVNALVLDSNLIALIIKALENNWVCEDMAFTYFIVDRKRFNTVMLEQGFNILLNIINSDISKFSMKFLKQFNIQNLQCLVNIFNDLALLWVSPDKHIKNGINNDIDSGNTMNNSVNTSTTGISATTTTTNTSTTNTNPIVVHQEIFEKYKDLPQNNLLTSIIQIFDNISYYFNLNINISSNTPSKLTPNQDTLNSGELSSITSFIEECSINMTSKLRSIELAEQQQHQEQSSTLSCSSFSNIIKAMPILKIRTQNNKEANSNLFSEFEFPFETVSYADVVQTIQSNYQYEIDMYFYPNNKGYIKVKNENDFLLILKQLLNAYQKGESVTTTNDCYIVVNCMITEKENAKIIAKCLNCNKTISITSKGVNTEPPFCEECKNKFFVQIAQQITMNNSLGAYNQNVINLSMLNGDGGSNGGSNGGNGNGNMSMMVNNVNSSIMGSPVPLKVLNKTTYI